MEKKYAILIDSDNISQKYTEVIFNEMATIGATPIRRIYGNFTKDNWQEQCLEHSIKQVHQYNYTKGKNATDSTMIIDAMDLLYNEQYLDGFVIVSSDSDFTGLCQRLREANKDVIGIGERKTPKSVVKACSVFKYIEDLLDESVDDIMDESIEEDTSKNLELIRNAIIDIVAQANGSILLSELKPVLLKRYNDFSEKTYGYNQMRRFLESLKGIKTVLQSDKTTYKVELTDEETFNESDKYFDVIKKIIDKKKEKWINLGELQSKLVKEQIDYKMLGFSRFSKFIDSISKLSCKKQRVTIK